MSTLDVTGSVRDTWECLNNQNSVNQLQQLWLTSSIEKYRGSPTIRLTALMGLPRHVARRQAERFHSGVAPLHRQPLHGSPPSTRRPGNQTGYIEQVSPNVSFTGMPGVHAAGHGPQAEVSAG